MPRSGCSEEMDALLRASERNASRGDRIAELARENERLRAENWRLRSLLNMWSATFAEFFVPGTLGGDLLVATRAGLAKYSRNAAEPNDQHNRTPDQGVPG